jgi:hypothetical protein
MRIAWHIGAILISLLLMTSSVFADSFCSDIDRVVRLAPSGFRSIVDEANQGTLPTAVTQGLPGASRCWLHNSARAYWCSWQVAPEQVKPLVEHLANAIGHCYQVRPDYDNDYGDAEPIAFIDLPNSVSIYISGERYSSAVTISIEAERSDFGPSPTHDGAVGTRIETP